MINIVKSLVFGSKYQYGNYGCNTKCYELPDASDIVYCLYRYTKDRSNCETQDSTIIQIKEDLQIITPDKINDEGIGGCTSLLDTSTSVIYIKWIIAGHGVALSDIYCEAVEGFDTPEPPW